METEQKQDDSPYGSFSLPSFFSSRRTKLSNFPLLRNAGILPFPRFSALKALLRSISRMMQTTGTADGLRNLIDSSLPKSVKKIMEYRKVFGPTVFSHGRFLHFFFLVFETRELTSLVSLRSNSSEHHGHVRSQRAHLPRRSSGSQVARGFLRCYRGGCRAFS